LRKVFASKDGEKARSNKAKGNTAPKKVAFSVPKKGKRGGDSGGPPHKKARTAKHCKHCKVAGGAFQTHDFSECRRFDKDGKEVGKPSKPFDSVKKPWKKGGSDSGQMAYLTEKFEKLKKKIKKSKKAAKMRVRDSSDSDSDSD
jgi:hypothetical protein